MDAAFVGLDLGALGDLGQEAFLVGDADTTGNGAVFGNGLAQFITDHAVAVLLAIFVVCQEVVDDLVSILAVVVVSVDNCEGSAVDGFACAQNCVAGTPGLGAVSGAGVACGQLVQLLVSVADLHGALLQTSTNGLHEVLLDSFLDDDNSSFEACLVCIKQGEVQNSLTTDTNGVDLLQAAVTAAHACCHNHQNGFLRHSKILLKELVFIFMLYFHYNTK